MVNDNFQGRCGFQGCLWRELSVALWLVTLALVIAEAPLFAAAGLLWQSPWGTLQPSGQP